MQQNPYLILVWFFAAFFTTVIFVNLIALIWQTVLDYRLRKLIKHEAAKKGSRA